MSVRRLAVVGLALLLATSAPANDTLVGGVEIPAEGVFHSGKATLTADSAARLQPLVQTLRAISDRAEISVHTDSMGSGAYNLSQSQQRADAIVAYLVSQGISADRLTAKGYGEDRPTASNSTADGRATNRRIELRFIDGDGDDGRGATATDPAPPPAAEPTRRQPVLPHEPVWVDYNNLWKNDFTSDFIEKQGGVYVREMVVVVPTDITAEFRAVFSGPKAAAATAEIKLEGQQYKPAINGEGQRWPKGEHTLRVTAKSRKTSYGIGLVGGKRANVAPTTTDDICTIFDYLTYQVSARMPDLKLPDSGLIRKTASVGGLEVWGSGLATVNAVMFSGTSETDAAQAYQDSANILVACLGDQVHPEVIDWANYNDTSGGTLKATMGMTMMAHVRSRKVVMAAHHSDFRVEVAEHKFIRSSSDQDRGQPPNRSVAIRVIRDPVHSRMD